MTRQPVEGGAIDLEIERAVLLAALDRRLDAQQAFVDILRRAPENFSADGVQKKSLAEFRS